MKFRTLFACVTLGCSLAVMAQNDAQQYCEEAYPADYYSPEDRQVYIQECLQQYLSDHNAYQPEYQDDSQNYQDNTQYDDGSQYQHSRHNIDYSDNQGQFTD